LKRSDGVLVLLTALTYPLGLLLGSPWVLPLLNTAPAYVLMVQRLRAGDRAGALRATLVWAAALAVFGTFTFTWWPSDPEGLVLHGAAYRDEMFTWIRTGLGTEGDLRRFLPQHVLHLAIFVALCLATASVASITMGAVLMNYMSYYVASLARAGTPAATVVFFGWQPWALCRVAAFCALGVVLSEPVLSRLLRYRYEGLRGARVVILAAAGGILADWILKAVLAPHWRLALKAALP
jgi:hypothetical protein